jgi:O-antigen ligase
MAGTATAASSRPSRLAAPAIVAGGLLLLGGFALGGPLGLPGLAAELALAAVLFLLAPPSLRLWVLPLLGLSTLLGQVSRGYNGFELALPWVVLAAVIVTLRRGERADWDVGLPGLFALIWVVIPLLALPRAVVSTNSFFGQYKVHLLLAAVFLALRRITPPGRSNTLLWIFPFIGAVGALQLHAKTSGLGGLFLSRMTFRNFYTKLPWGQSDFISATMEFCLCMCVVLWILDRRPLARLALVLAAIPMLEAFFLLFSRGGAIGFALFLLVLAVGLGGRKGIAAFVLGGGVAVLGFLTEGGQVFLGRFTNPADYASWYLRIVVWGVAWQRFVNHFWTGMGLNQGRYQGDQMGDLTSHNLFLDALGEQGIFGGLFLLVLVIASFRMCLRVRPPGADSPESLRAVRVALVATLTQLYAHAMVEPTLHGMTIAVGFVYLLAWLSIHSGAPATGASPMRAPVPGGTLPPHVPGPPRTPALRPQTP